MWWRRSWREFIQGEIVVVFITRVEKWTEDVNVGSGKGWEFNMFSRNR